MAKTFDPEGVELFSLFDFDAGKLFRDPSLEGESLYTFRPIQRTGKTVDFTAMSADELKAARNEEQRQRAAQLEGLINEETLARLEREGKSITDLLSPPIYV